MFYSRHCAGKYDGVSQRPYWVAQSAAFSAGAGSNILFSNGVSSAMIAYELGNDYT